MGIIESDYRLRTPQEWQAFAHNGLGICHQAQGKLEEAIGEFRETLRISPNYAEAHYNLGEVFEAQGKPQEAIGCYQEFIHLAPPKYSSHVKTAEQRISQLRQKT